MLPHLLERRRALHSALGARQPVVGIDSGNAAHEFLEGDEILLGGLGVSGTEGRDTGEEDEQDGELDPFHWGASFVVEWARWAQSSMEDNRIIRNSQAK